MPDLVVDEALVRSLVATQFPQWSRLAIRIVEPGGRDNRVFRLGDRMVVRLPSGANYSAQTRKEAHWLPILAPQLPLRIPEPLALGHATSDYPWQWSIYGWINGRPATCDQITDIIKFAVALAEFLIALERIDPTGGPLPGPHNFHRGGSLSHYDGETRQAIALLGDKIDSAAVNGVWSAALDSAWCRSPVWIHGDVSAANLLLQNDHLAAVIDFGLLGIGDPACDLAIAWTLFDPESRRAFREALQLDAGTWARARGWTLWKALIAAAGLSDANACDRKQSWQLINRVLIDQFDA